MKKVMFICTFTCIYSNTETMATCKGCLFKSGDFAEKFEQPVWIIIDARYLFDYKVLLDRGHYFALLTMMCSRNAPIAKHFVLWAQPSFMQKNTC